MRAHYTENLVKPSEMPRPLALTGITAHTQKHFTSSDKTQKEKYIHVHAYIFLFEHQCDRVHAVSV